jgi:micrococcal nuclease
VRRIAGSLSRARIRAGVALLATVTAGSGCADGMPATGGASEDRIARVTDGDTVVLAGLGKSRLIGVDTPEVHGGRECYGREASEYVKRLLPPARAVRYRFDVERRDRYGRALIYLWVGSRFVNGALARNGFAVPMTIPPNVRYADRIAALARTARVNGRGLWSRPGCAG